MKTRPVFVAAHSVPVSLGARSTAATKPPIRVVPYTGGGKGGMSEGVSVRSVCPAGPMRAKSPHAGLAPEVVNSGQFASRYAWLPPQFCVRQTLCEPWKIVPALAGFGSAMIGA
jgi:hypothetical protein